MPSKTSINQTQQATKGALNTAQQQGGQYNTAAGTGYQNFATTGGVTPQQQNLTRQQAAAGIGSLYGDEQRQLQKQKAVQGGYAPGYAANMEQANRSMANAAGGAINQANLGLIQQQQQGQLAGLGGLSNIGALYQGQVPQLLGTQANLAAVKPGLEQEISGWTGLVGQIGQSAAGAFG